MAMSTSRLARPGEICECGQPATIATRRGRGPFVPRCRDEGHLIIAVRSDFDQMQSDAENLLAAAVEEGNEAVIAEAREILADLAKSRLRAGIDPEP
jgi:hypothetical protein